MPRITFVRLWEETEPSWDRGGVPWIFRVAVRWGITIVGFLVAEVVINGIYDEDKWFTDGAEGLLIASAIFVGLRLVLRPVLLFLTCPLQLLTLGLFVLVINAVIVLITEWIGEIFNIGFEVAGFIPAFLGAVVISLVSFVISRFLRSNPIGPNLRGA